MMNSTMSLLLALIAGFLLGGIFFSGLWWTVRKGLSAKHPALVFFLSILLRTGIVLTGFYFVGQGKWERLLVCLAGFLVARFIIMRYVQPSVTERVQSQ